MSWFKRIKKNITTTTEGKKDIPKGLWYKSPSGNIVDSEQLKANFFVSPEDDYHVRIASNEYFDILFDEGQFSEMDEAVESVDILNFSDSKKYTERLKEAKKTSGLNDSIRNAVGKIHNKSVVISCMDFGFIGGSMGSVVGEKISRAVDYSLKHKLPYVLICKSGGARMMESAHSLMQLAKIQAKLIQLSNAKLPYIPVLTDPTFGGVTASFAMVGDIIIAEPGALIGFAGPRVIKETIGKDLPEGFQTSEFVLEHGFIDLIIHRRELKDRLTNILDILMPNRA